MGNLTKRIVFFALMAAFTLGLSSLAAAATYYVATNGNDRYDGRAPSWDGVHGPWQTLQKAGNAVVAGDVCYIRGGTYAGTSSWGYNHDGTAASPIKVTNYNGEAVIIDGGGTTPGHTSGGALFQIYGDYFDVSNLEVRYSGYMGLVIHGDHVTVSNIYAHHNYKSGITGTGDYIVIQDCRAYYNSVCNEWGVLSVSWSTGITLGRYPRYGTIRRCVAWNNWGQGLSTYEGYYNTIEDSVAYDNFSVNIYLSDSERGTVRRCLSYYTPGNLIRPYVSSQNCIGLGDELRVPASRYNTVVNNLCWGGDRGIWISGKNFQDTLVAHNTFANAFGQKGPDDSGCVYITAGTSTGGRFVNNLVLQEDGTPIGHMEASGVFFGYNLWSRLPVSACRGTGDVVGDPLLAKTGSLAAGELGPGWFKITSGSPAIGRATVLSQVTEDFLGNARGSAPDIGAFNISDGTTALSASASGSPTTGTSPLVVTFTGSAAGGRAPYSYLWDFGDGSGSANQNTAHTYGTAGQYTATLTVTDDARTVASATVGISVDTAVTVPLTARIEASSLSGKAPLTVNFTGSGSGGTAPYTYAWSFGDGGSSTAQSPSRTFSAAGTYTVTLTVTDRAGVRAAATATVQATSSTVTVLSANGSSSPSGGRAPLFVQFTATAGGGTAPYVYHWSFGDGTYSNRQYPAHTFSSSGTYTVTLTVTDARSARTTSSLKVSVLPAQARQKDRGGRDRKAQPRLILR